MRTLRDKLFHRLRLLTGRNAYGLRARLETLRPGRASDFHAILASCRTPTSNPATHHFRLGRRRFYFQPPYPVREPRRLREGTAKVLAETVTAPEEMFHARVSPKPGDIVIDGGAHIGTSAITLAERVLPGGHVYSFEPVMHGALRQNLAENGIEGVTVVPKALGRAAGPEEITVDDIAIDSSIARARGTGIGRGNTIPIEVTTIDAFVEENGLDRVDVIKLDIEGAEDMAIDGAAKVIDRFHPAWTIASYHVDFDGDLQHPKLLRQLRGHGYKVEEVLEGGKGVRIYAW